MGKLLRWFKLLFVKKKDSVSQQLVAFIRSITGAYPLNLSLYKVALCHSSISGEDSYSSNERLEFLGDAVLSLVVATFLFKKYPLKGEGFLTDVRSRLVNRDLLNVLAHKIHLDKLLNCNAALVKERGAKSIYGNALEAFIGAVYLDHGYLRCERFIIERLIGDFVNLRDLVEQDTNFKSKIVQWAQKRHLQVTFRILKEEQYDNYREFTAQVVIDDKVMGEGTGRTKKYAEQMAAQQALQQVQLL